MSSSPTSSGLQGTLATVPFSDLLQLLSVGRKTGTLTLRNGRHVKRIFFKDGEIISSSSDDPAEFLGQFLLYQGKISEEQLKKALENQEKTGILIGKILVTVGAMTEEDVVATLVQKAEETVFSLFLWEGGSFTFEEGNLPRQTLIPISLKVQDILLEGAKALDDLQRIRQEFRSGRAILRRTRNAAPPAALNDRLSAAIYRRLDGNMSIPDLCLEFRCSELSASKALYALYQQGYVEVIGAAAAEAQPVDSTSLQALIAKGQELQAQGNLGSAIDHLRRALIMSPSDAKLREMVERAEAQFLDKARQHLLPPHKIPVLRMSLETLVNENLSPEEGFLVSRINGTWDLKSIISISPLREVDALRCVDRLRRRGILELREPPPKPADEEEEAPTRKPLAPVTD